jgi:hypothetical protein
MEFLKKILNYYENIIIKRKEYNETTIKNNNKDKNTNTFDYTEDPFFFS